MLGFSSHVLQDGKLIVGNYLLTLFGSSAQSWQCPLHVGCKTLAEFSLTWQQDRAFKENCAV